MLEVATFYKGTAALLFAFFVALSQMVIRDRSSPSPNLFRAPAGADDVEKDKGGIILRFILKGTRMSGRVYSTFLWWASRGVGEVVNISDKEQIGYPTLSVDEFFASTDRYAQKLPVFTDDSTRLLNKVIDLAIVSGVTAATMRKISCDVVSFVRSASDSGDERGLVSSLVMAIEELESKGVSAPATLPPSPVFPPSARNLYTTLHATLLTSLPLEKIVEVVGSMRKADAAVILAGVNFRLPRMRDAVVGFSHDDKNRAWKEVNISDLDEAAFVIVDQNPATPAQIKKWLTSAVSIITVPTATWSMRRRMKGGGQYKDSQQKPPLVTFPTAPARNYKLLKSVDFAKRGGPVAAPDAECDSSAVLEESSMI